MSLKETVEKILQSKRDLRNLTVTELAHSLSKELGANEKTIRRHLYRLQFHKRQDKGITTEDSQEYDSESYDYDEETRVYRFPLAGEEDLYAYAEEVSSWIQWYTNAGEGLPLREVCKKCWGKTQRNLSEKRLKKIFSLLEITKLSPPLAPHSFKELSPEELVEEWRLIAESEIQSKYEAGEAKHWRSLYEIEKKKTLRVHKIVEETLRTLPGVTPVDFNKDSGLCRHPKEVGPCTPVLLLSDWHIGMDDLDYNSKVLGERLQVLFREVSEWVEIYCRPFDEFHIAIAGDILDGAVELRAGHSFQQDLHGAEQIAFAAETLASMISKISAMVKVPVKVHAVTGNHGRATKNYKGDPERLCESICYMFADKMTPGITWEIHSEIVAHWEIYSTTCFLTHGDRTPKNLDSLVLSHNCTPPAIVLSGHKHELNCSQKNQVFTVSGGSLCGTTSFSRDQLGLSSTPSQVLVEIRKDGPRPVYYIPV